MIDAFLGAATVIGGADGPTAIFMTSNMPMTTIILICLGAGLAVGLVLGFIYIRTKNKKDGR